ncbi:hypothetical protein W02_27320 [Nitrospira sp. KM1]|nr:hypothetical protein W02_27320 [Nitrospira sp. KM1]
MGPFRKNLGHGTPVQIYLQDWGFETIGAQDNQINRLPALHIGSSAVLNDFQQELAHGRWTWGE